MNDFPEPGKVIGRKTKISFYLLMGLSIMGVLVSSN